MEPKDALEATKDDMATAAELVDEDPENAREAVEMIIHRYEEYRGEESEITIEPYN